MPESLPSHRLINHRSFSGAILSAEELAYVFNGDKLYLRQIADIAISENRKKFGSNAVTSALDVTALNACEVGA